jgi:hypothetical protein
MRCAISSSSPADLDTVKERFTCRGCKGRNPTVWSMSTPMDEDQEFDDMIEFAE